MPDVVVDTLKQLFSGKVSSARCARSRYQRLSDDHDSNHSVVMAVVIASATYFGCRVDELMENIPDNTKDRSGITT